MVVCSDVGADTGGGVNVGGAADNGKSPIVADTDVSVGGTIEGAVSGGGVGEVNVDEGDGGVLFGKLGQGLSRVLDVGGVADGGETSVVGGRSGDVGGGISGDGIDKVVVTGDNERGRVELGDGQGGTEASGGDCHQGDRVLEERGVVRHNRANVVKPTVRLGTIVGLKAEELEVVHVAGVGNLGSSHARWEAKRGEQRVETESGGVGYEDLEACVGSHHDETAGGGGGGGPVVDVFNVVPMGGVVRF